MREAERVEAEPSHDVVEGPAQRVRRLCPQQLALFRELESAHVSAAFFREVRRVAVGDEAADVHFLVGGTQANATVIASILRPWQGVIAADCGHIATHETGAVEAHGHKVLTLPGADGKLDAAQLRDFMESYWQASGIKEHIVQPGMVYLSQPTELGTVYSRAELAAIAQTCFQFGIPFVVIRALSDTADEKADTSFEQFLQTAAAHSAEMVERIIATL